MKKERLQRYMGRKRMKAGAAVLVAAAMVMAQTASAFEAEAGARKEEQREETLDGTVSGGMAWEGDRGSWEKDEPRRATDSDAEFWEIGNFYGQLASDAVWTENDLTKEGEYAGFQWTLDDHGVMTVSGEGDIPDNDQLEELSWYPCKSIIKKIVFEEGITSIGGYLFSVCKNLASVEIPEGVTRIGPQAFWKCPSLCEVTLPDTVVFIDARAFDQCPMLPDKFPVSKGLCGDNIQWLLTKDQVLTVSGEGPMPDGSSWTDFDWFSCFDIISEIVVEEGITTVGAYAFDGCKKVPYIYLPDGITAIGDGAFSFCDSLTGIRIPESVTSIGDNAFCACVSLIGVEIPEAVTRIGLNAFYGCTNLSDVTIPDSVVTIVGGAFSKCPNLSGVIPIAKDTYDEHLRWILTSDGVMRVIGDRDIPDMGQSYIVGQETPPYGGHNWNMLWREEDVKKVIIEEGITAVGKSAFGSCKNLVSVELPHSLTEIGVNAFGYCDNLADIELPEGLKRVERWAFINTGITSVTIPSSVDFVSQTAFPKGTELIFEKLEDRFTEPLKMTEDMGFAQSNNAHAHNYHVHPQNVIQSYLWTGESGNLFRTEYSQDWGQVKIEEYSPDYQFVRSWNVPLELPKFGGFYQDGEEFYLVFGQNNPEESDDTEVVRVVKYSKDMERLDSASVYGLEAAKPFHSGSLRMDKKGSYLYIHTSKLTYELGGAGHHQKNMTIAVNTDGMVAVLDEQDNLGRFVSHSFNQFVKVVGDRVILIDQGDGFPARSVLLGCYEADDIGADPVVRRMLYLISGEFGENYTGVMLGDVEVSDTCILTAGTSIDQENFEDSYVYNIFLSVIETDKVENTREYRDIQVTDYEEGGKYCAGNPCWVKISDDLFVLMWERLYTNCDKKNMIFKSTGIVEAAFFDGQGNQLCNGKIGSFEGSLSDCHPIVCDGQIVWYVTDGSDLTFYTLSAECPDEIWDLEVGKVVLRGQNTGQGADGGAAGDGGAGENGEDAGSGSSGENGGSGGNGGSGENSGSGNSGSSGENGGPGDSGSSGENGGSDDSGNSGGNGNSSEDQGTGGTGSGSGNGTGDGSGSSGGNPGTGTGETGSTGDGSGGDNNESERGPETAGGSGNEGTGSSGNGIGSGGLGISGIGGIGGTGGSGGNGTSGGGSGNSGGSGGSRGSGSSGGSGGSGGSGSSGGKGGSGGGGQTGSGGPGSSKGSEITGNPSMTSGSSDPAAAPVLTGTWLRDARGWWLEKPDKSYPKSQWARIGGAVYHFNDAGYMDEGWIFLNGRWYYLIPGSGAMSTGWVQVSDRWYYLNSDGVMATGWICLSGTWYYLNPDGAMATGWICVAGKWYYLKQDGAMLADTITPDHYAVGPDGAWIPQRGGVYDA